MDLAKYRALFLEEATDHLGEMGRALLCLEKDPEDRDSIDLAFRMAHSIKGMAGTLGYDSITELSHRLEDRLALYREEGCADARAGLPLLFEGLDGLERMVAHVRQTGDDPPPDPELCGKLSADAEEVSERDGPEPEPKKVHRRHRGAAAPRRARPQRRRLP